MFSHVPEKCVKTHPVMFHGLSIMLRNTRTETSHFCSLCSIKWLTSMAVWMHRRTVLRSWGLLSYHSFTAMTSSFSTTPCAHPHVSEIYTHFPTADNIYLGLYYSCAIPCLSIYSSLANFFSFDLYFESKTHCDECL